MLNVQPSCQTNKLLFGVATTDITPPVGVTLMGYDPRISESVGHPLRAEALACANPDGGGWLMVSADVCGFSAPLTNVVRAAIADGTGLDVSAIMIAATHTHSGPHVSDALWCERSELESAYFAELRAKLVEVALRAWNARTPGTLVTAETAAPGFGSNRRARNADGTWYNQWSDPEGTNTGYNDPGIDLVGVRRPDGTLDALLVVFGCHPVSFGSRNLAISGDYVGHLKDALEQSGAVRTAMFSVAGTPTSIRAFVQAIRRSCKRRARAWPRLSRRRCRVEARAGRCCRGGARAVEFQTTWSPQGRVSIYFLPRRGRRSGRASAPGAWAGWLSSGFPARRSANTAASSAGAVPSAARSSSRWSTTSSATCRRTRFSRKAPTRRCCHR